MSNDILVEIYSKDKCQLCDEAKEVIKAVNKEIPFIIKEIDITKDDILFEKYKYDIPVIHINGVIAFKHRLTAFDFRKKLMTRNLI